MASLHELMAEEEAAALERTRLEIAAEKAAWDALTPEAQQVILDKRQAEYDALWNGMDAAEEEACDECGEYPENCECDSDDELDD